ncbi:hypothetical protein F4604DRAFT_812996 [Suillus subluteus]|nr:hypothetical protein F4604DRAFT_812996 [Suillus subluteus]
MYEHEGHWFANTCTLSLLHQDHQIRVSRLYVTLISQSGRRCQRHSSKRNNVTKLNEQSGLRKVRQSSRWKSGSDSIKSTRCKLKLSNFVRTLHLRRAEPNRLLFAILIVTLSFPSIFHFSSMSLCFYYTSGFTMDIYPDDYVSQTHAGLSVSVSSFLARPASDDYCMFGCPLACSLRTRISSVLSNPLKFQR